MSVLDRAELEQSPLADLHTLASELSVDGYRRMRRAELIDRILGRRLDDSGAALSGEPEGGEGDGEAEEAAPRRRRARRVPRARSAPSEEASDPREEAPRAQGEPDATAVEPAKAPSGRTRARSARAKAENGSTKKAGGARAKAESSRAVDDEERAGRPKAVEEVEKVVEGADDQVVEGVVELLAGGSAFMRVQPPEPSDDDVYVSAAQVKRCELVSGDRISGPRRAPRRSERFASLVRVDTINGRPATEVANAARFDDLPAAFPGERLRLGSEDPTVKAIEWLTPVGRGSRVTIVGARQAGKTEALRRLASALAGQEELQVSLALAGVRPEEISEWSASPVAPTAAVSFAASADAQGQAVERVIDQARRVAARGADAVVLVDTLDGLHPHLARRLLACARNIVQGGSLTVIATASAPIGGETTVIALDVTLASAARFPALDLAISGTMRPELLVGEAGAEAIARARAQAMDPEDV